MIELSIGRRVSRILALLALLALVGAACGGDDEAGGGDEFKVALVLPGVASDQGFNQAAFEALPIIEEEFGAVTAFTERTAVADYEQAFRDYAEQGFDVVIGQGFEFGEPVNAVADDYPDTIFLVTHNEQVAGENKQGLVPQAHEGGFLAGIVGAMASDADKLGVIGGLEFPPIVANLEAYKLGAEWAEPGIEVTITYLGTLDDPEKGKETARAMISDGVDVLFQIADAAGVGVLQAAEETGIRIIGWPLDQSNIAPNASIGCQIVDQTRMIVEGVRGVVEGNFTGETRFFGLDTTILGLCPLQNLDQSLVDQINAKVEEAKQMILSGELEVPFIPEPQ